ncbi:MAG: SRPBCC domain-containing protein [Chloroflexota bacterium]|nr:SRPBCC domain-containing protein [Chloroflexota bacterium]
MTQTKSGKPMPNDRVHTESLGDDVVVATVTVDAPRSVVFTAFTDPEVLAQWFWPQRFGTRIETDLRPGGAFSIHADGLPAGQEMGVTGTYQDVESPGRLAMSWQWKGESAVSHVAIKLNEVSETRTEVVITHSANPSPADRDGHLEGWRDCLGRLSEASAMLSLALRGR